MRVLALTLLAAAASAADVELPALPVRVAFRPNGRLCSSAAMRKNLEYRFWRIVGEGDASDLRVDCSEGRDEVILDVRTGSGGARFRVERTASSTDEGTAYLAAYGAAKDSEIVAAALDAYLARNASLAAAGSEDFSAADWTGAAQHLAVGLESDLNLAPIYFGLYRAHAELGHPVKAKWYLMAYLRAADRKPDSLTKEQAMPLIRVEATGAKDGADADAAFEQYRQYAAAKRWDAALRTLHEVIAQAPWYEPAYVSLAESYEGIGWKRLAKLWRKRAVFTRKLNKDVGLGKDVEARLDAVVR